MPTTTKKPKKSATKPEDIFRNLVKDAMKAQDHSIADVARGAQIADEKEGGEESGRLTLSRWLGGTRGLRVEQLAKVLEYLGIKIGPYSAKAKRA